MSAFWEVIKWIFLFSAVLLLQSAVVPRIAIFGIYPDLVLILLVVLGTQKGQMTGIWGGFFVGLFIDVFSAGLLGANSLAKSIIGCIAGIFERKNVLVSPVALLVLLPLLCILHDLIVFIPNIHQSGGNIAELPRFLISSSLPRAVYTTFVATILLIIWENFIPLKKKR